MSSAVPSISSVSSFGVYTTPMRTSMRCGSPLPASVGPGYPDGCSYCSPSPARARAAADGGATAAAATRSASSRRSMRAALRSSARIHWRTASTIASTPKSSPATQRIPRPSADRRAGSRPTSAAPRRTSRPPITAVVPSRATPRNAWNGTSTMHEQEPGAVAHGTRDRVEADDEREEQQPDEHEVRVHAGVHPVVAQRQLVQAGEVQDDQRPGEQHPADHRVGDRAGPAGCAAPPGARACVRAAARLQRERHRPPQDEQDRRHHPEQHVLDDVQAEEHPVVRGQSRHRGDDDHDEPDAKATERGAGQCRPRASSRRTPVR